MTRRLAVLGVLVGVIVLVVACGGGGNSSGGSGNGGGGSASQGGGSGASGGALSFFDHAGVPAEPKLAPYAATAPA